MSLLVRFRDRVACFLCYVKPTSSDPEPWTLERVRRQLETDPASILSIDLFGGCFLIVIREETTGDGKKINWLHGFEFPKGLQ